ncbi:MAG: tripartite tricarboxylate transporter permease [Alphaproteobacteria bacterium]
MSEVNVVSSAIEGLSLVLQWQAFGYMLIGILLGIWLGAVPGLGGVLGLVILLPFTFGMDPVSAFALLLGMYAVTTTSDTIASILLGIPGTAASQATILDGYPLAQKGEARRAFGAAYAVSAFGGVFGALILAVSLPLILPLILAFASPELFMLGVLGIAMIGSLASSSILKGLVIALLGLLMSTVGYGEAVAIPRFWFGTDYLLDGIPLIPVVLGLFAIPELIELATKNVNISRVQKQDSKDVTIMTGVRDAWTHKWLALRSSLIGTYVGMLPGLGAAIVDWIAYGHALQSAKDSSKFGQGDIRGVIAPEAANNATKGGSLVPTVAFGIPGSLGTAILLGALMIQGLKPGPDMLTSELPLTFSMVWTIVIANIICAGLLMVLTNQVARIAFIRGHLIVPGVILFIFMGAWIGGTSIGDWVTCLGMGVVGFLMKRSGWPRPPLVLALILGSLMEESFQISMRAYDGASWVSRPIVLIIAGLVVLTLYFSVRGVIKTKATNSDSEMGEGAERNPLISLPFAMLLLLVFAWSCFEARQWPVSARLFPMLIAIPGTILVLSALFFDVRSSRQFVAASSGLSAGLAAASEKAVLGRAMIFFGYLLCIILITLVAGQIVGLLAFIAAYLVRWGGYGWRVSLLYTGICGAFLYGFYGEVMHIFWHPSMLDGFYGELFGAIPNFF